jgi:hypothetical protein
MTMKKYLVFGAISVQVRAKTTIPVVLLSHVVENLSLVLHGDFSMDSSNVGGDEEIK